MQLACGSAAPLIAWRSSALAVSLSSGCSGPVETERADGIVGIGAPASRRRHGRTAVTVVVGGSETRRLWSLNFLY